MGAPCARSTIVSPLFFRGSAGAVAVTAAACGSGSNKPESTGEAAKDGASKDGATLKILQYSHFVPAYDQWFDNEYTKRWGEQHNVDVVVDHIEVEQLAGRAAAEVAAQRGHDLVWFVWPPAVFEDDVIDHREVVEEVEAKVGKMVPFVERSIFNPTTKKWFGFSDTWFPAPVHFRSDLWAPIGIKPDSWDAILAGAPGMKAAGHPVGLGISNSNSDATATLQSLLHAYGSGLQDEVGNVAINRPETVEALKTMTAIYRAGMTEDVLSWDSSSNNRYLAEGRGSLIVNAVSALRAIEAQEPGLAAKQFLIDLAVDYRQAFERSGFYNLPSFPGAVTDLPGLLAREPKYSLLTDAAGWSTNLGHPGYANAAVDEVFTQFVIPEMFATAARGEMSAEEAVTGAEAQMKPIFEKWRERGKI